ncbi:1,4-alpha-glucan branching protein domain-containing protein [Cryptosporangium aurantiacum]|uniref:1,4-alpha-glucan branching enzyme n=1 Tax=Cryptosporangium aurantiacum TaxID=134849 RepID=A0A1M7HHZ5_9ACTN|nr:glycoside hydrolase family 57 protein [Cryptosporangium aurantiacum]SHM27767.1 1,4-alpha-glucan branching enzyme [Cryptosporangium aurantiacum]
MRPVGTFCLVLHTHLPWLPHAGTWPVGEEWFHQAFAGSWRRVVTVLDRLAAEGRRDVLTLGVTPVTAAMLDDRYLLDELHTWLGNWQLRAQLLAGRPERHLRTLATHEFREATAALADFEGRWRHGGSPVLRNLADSGVVELLGGPATHPFQPLLRDRFQRFALSSGLDDGALRFGARPPGIWAPECGYAPGLETSYAEAGVTHVLVDGPTLRRSTAIGRAETRTALGQPAGRTAFAHPVGTSSVLAFGRDLDVTYRVWSPKAGYPGGPDYRDFHTFDHPTGFRPARVTGKQVAPELKAPWDPTRAAAAVSRDADDFVRVVHDRLTRINADEGRPGLVVAAYDTELFGHWWYEGPSWLEAVLRRLPEAGVHVTTLAGAAAAGLVGEPRELPASSWGSGKDWRVWDGEQVADLVVESRRVQDRLMDVVDKASGLTRNPVLDQLAREALLVASSDWAFMVTKDSAAGYARDRAATHTARFDRLADLVESGREPEAAAYAAELATTDNPFGHLDARTL